MVTLTVPISTTPPPENTLALLTTPTVQLWTVAPQPGTGLLPKHKQIYDEEQQVKLGLQHFNQEKNQAMGEELSRLLGTSFIKEIRHLDWIANPFLV
jgi:hypothetical protein